MNRQNEIKQLNNTKIHLSDCMNIDDFIDTLPLKIRKTRNNVMGNLCMSKYTDYCHKFYKDFIEQNKSK